jgi:hypothetical protein
VAVIAIVVFSLAMVAVTLALRASTGVPDHKLEPMPIDDEKREPWRDNYQNALTALRMVREMIETQPRRHRRRLPEQGLALRMYGRRIAL